MVCRLQSAHHVGRGQACLVQRQRDTGRALIDVHDSFSPLDLPDCEFGNAFVNLFKVLEIPNEFTVERINSVSHSFGSRTSEVDGSVTVWFHFLCKHIKLDCRRPTTSPGMPGWLHLLCERINRLGMPRRGSSSDGPPRRQPTVVISDDSIRQDAEQGFPGSGAGPLPQESYSYSRAGFVLQITADRRVTLTCFGVPANGTVYNALMRLINNHPWDEVVAQPLILLDAVLDGLWAEVDEMVWHMNEAFGSAEKVSLRIGVESLL